MASQHMHKRGKKSDLMEAVVNNKCFKRLKYVIMGGGWGWGVGWGRQHKMIKVAWATS